MKFRVQSIIFFIFLSLILLVSIRGLPGNPSQTDLNTNRWRDDGPFELSPERGRFALMYSLVEEGSLFYSLPIARFATPDLGYKNGRYVSLFAPAVSFLIAPGYVIGKAFGNAQVGAYLTIGVFAALNAFLIYLVAKRLGGQPFIGMIAGCLFLFATPAFPYAVSLYQHHISTFLILMSLYLLLRSKGFWSTALIWLLCAFSIPLDYPNLFLMFPIGLAALGRIIEIENKEESVTVKFLPVRLCTFLLAILPLVFFLWFNQASYGNPLQLSGTVAGIQEIDAQGKPVRSSLLKPQDTSTQELRAKESRSAVAFFQTRNVLNGFYIHLISPDRGVLWYAPVVLIGIMGLYLFYKEKNRHLALLVGIVLADLLLYSMWGDPWGGWAFGSRYLIPAYAMLSILASVAITKYRKNIPFLLVVFALAAYSIRVNTAGALTSNRNPPQVEVLSLEAVSGKEEKFTYERNMDMLKNNTSKSFFFQSVAQRWMNAWRYYQLISGTLIGACAVLFVMAYVTAKRENDE